MQRTQTAQTYNLQYDRGIGLLEIVVGVGIITASLVGIATAFTLYFRAVQANTETIRAAYLLEEGVEALIHLRNTSWDVNIAPFASDTTYYLSFAGSQWDIATAEVVIEDVLVRSFVLDDVYRRELDDDIVPETSPDTKYLDPDIKHVTITVMNTETNKETAIETYLTNLFRN